ncbi:hypothetical protein D3C71_1387350 [compost metagenome]
MIRHHRMLGEVGGDVDDAALRAPLEMRQRGAAYVERRADRAVELRLVVLPGDVVERGPLARIEGVMPQGVVDDDIQPAGVLHDAVDHRAHRLRRADVGLHGPGVAADGLALRHHGLGRIGVAQVVDDHRRAFPRKAARDLGADAAAGAGHQHHFACELQGGAHVRPPAAGWRRRRRTRRCGSGSGPVRGRRRPPFAAGPDPACPVAGRRRRSTPHCAGGSLPG